MGQLTAQRLVAREAELAALTRCLDGARQQQPVTVLVEGEAGIGKSRLIAAAVSQLTDPEDVVMVGHGVDLSGGEIPYGAMADALRDLVRREGVDRVRAVAGDAVRPLGALCPGLATFDANVDRGQLFQSYLSVVERLAADRLVCLVVEDLHWTDSSSRDLLNFLVRSIGDCRLATVISLRTDDPRTPTSMPVFIAELARADNVQRVQLSRFTRPEVVDQLSSLLVDQPEPDLIDQVVQLSQGIPYLTELLVDGGIATSGQVPATVLELMLARTASLSRAARRLVEMASLAEGSLSHARLAGVYGVGNDTLEDAVAEAVDAHVLRIGSSGHEYYFQHALLREAVAGSLLPADRMRWHRRWAEQLGPDRGLAPDPILEIAAAHHWAHSGDTERAFDAALQAADRAESVGAMTEKAALLTRALELWPRVPDAAARADRSRDEVLDDAVVALDAVSDFTGALALLDTEIGRGSSGDAVRDLCVRLARSSIAQQLGHDPDEGLYDEARAAVDRLIAAKPGSFLVEGLIDLGWHELDDDPEAARRLHNRALEVADSLGDLHRRQWATSTVAYHLGAAGKGEDGLALCTAFLGELTNASPRLQSLMETECGLWMCHLGRYRQAVELLTRTMTRLGGPHLAPSTWAYANEILCEALISAGDWEEARSRLAEGQRARQGGDLDQELDKMAGILACYTGDLKAADGSARLAELSLPPHEETFWLPGRLAVRWLNAEIAAARGDLTRVWTELAPLWDAPNREMAFDLWRPLLLAARVESELAAARHRDRSGRQQDSASAHVGKLRETAEGLHRFGELGSAWETHLQAELAYVDGATDPAPWAAAEQAWDRVGNPYYRIWALARLAACQVASGDRRTAVAPVQQALALAGRLGARPLVEYVTALARRTGLLAEAHASDLPAAESARFAALTARELEVLRLVAQGLTNDEIARELFISPKTASVHVSRILAKLDLPSRTRAAALAHAEGIV